MSRVKVTALMCGAIALAAVLAGSEEANAGWRHGSWGSSSSSSGSWGSSSSSSSSSSGSWGSSSSSSGSWGHRAHYRRAHRHYRRSSSSGSWGSSSSSSGSSSSSSGSWGSSSSSSSSGGYSTPSYQVVPESSPAEKTESPTPPPVTETSVNLTVTVPADAKVFVNGAKTTTKGEVRSYVSRGLTAGKSYTFKIRADVVRDGKTVSETKTVRVAAGGNGTLAFDMGKPAAENVADKSVETKLTLNVPAEAKVYLSGQETKQEGSVREYTTKRLDSGKTWDNYVVRVTLDRDGRTLSQERTLKLVGGQPQSVNFDFAADTVASATR